MYELELSEYTLASRKGAGLSTTDVSTAILRYSVPSRTIPEVLISSRARVWQTAPDYPVAPPSLNISHTHTHTHTHTHSVVRRGQCGTVYVNAE